MSSEPPPPKEKPQKESRGPFFMEPKEIKRLIGILSAAGAMELELRDGDARLKIRMPEPGVRTEMVPVPSPYPVGSFMGPAPAGAPNAAASEGSQEASPQADASRLPAGARYVKAPLVGTFYRAPSPEAEPFVKIGTKTKPDSTVCIIEAMKVMNEIKAELEAKVLEILVENGEPVEFGQPLMILEPI
ncbi:MAG: acetyl-CoA carboxylase biotin carboxyl carrier protein [Planctomycetota bacterium]